MQLVKTTRDAILRPLQIVSGIVERRHTLPILANILIRKNGEQVSFLSTDTEVQIVTSAQVGSGAEEGATTVAARKLLDILRALSDRDDVSLSLANKRLTIQSGKSRFALQTLGAEDFPTLAVTESWGATLNLPQKIIRQLFGLVHFSMAQQDIRYYLNGLLLVLDGPNVIAVGTDGHRLAYASVHGEREFTRQEVIIPRKTVLELSRLLEDSDEPVQIDIGASQIRFSFAEVALVSKLVEGKFPDYTRVIPSGHPNSFIINRDTLLRALQRSAILTSDKFKGVRCAISPGLLKISAHNTEQEEAAEEIEIDYGGESLEIAFNVTYLLDVLNNLKSDHIQVALGDARSSVLITIPDSESFKYVVMPMRI